MKVIVEHTRFIDDKEVDLNYINLQKYKKILCIATRDGQIYRVKKWIDEQRKLQTELGIILIFGWWDLRANGLLENNDIWQQFDCVIFLDPERCAYKFDYEYL